MTASEVIVLVVLSWNDSSGGMSERQYEMPSWQQCQAALVEARLDVSDGGDSEGGAVLFCAGDKLCGNYLKCPGRQQR